MRVQFQFFPVSESHAPVPVPCILFDDFVKNRLRLCRDCKNNE